jgi:REP element-mobilizing transposase RayT
MTAGSRHSLDPVETPRFFNPYGEIRFTKNLLPHWQQNGATYFITFRLADSVPTHLRTQWEEERATWLRFHPEPWDVRTELEYHKRFTGAIERWLDAGYGSCVLRRIECAKIVDEALRHFDRQRLVLISSVVMPSHVHALLIQNPEHPLEHLLHSWKSFSSRNVNRLVGRSGTLWQRSYFDRLVRDEKHFRNCLRYIRRNPKKAHLKPGEYILYESDVAKQME